MKTKVLSKFALCCALLFTFLTSEKVNAQVSCTGPYTINNYAGCTIVVGYRYLCNGSPCSTSPANTIGIGGNLVLNPSTCGCGGSCDVEVTLKSMGGTPLSPGPVTVSSGNTSATFAPPASCPTSAGTMGWTTTHTDIN